MWFVEKVNLLLNNSLYLSNRMEKKQVDSFFSSMKG